MFMTGITADEGKVPTKLSFNSPTGLGGKGALSLDAFKRMAPRS